MLKKFATIYWKGRKNWDFSTIAAWFNYRPIFWGWFVGHSVSMISHKNTFPSEFASFLTILLLLYSQFQNQLFLFHFQKIVWNVLFLILVFILHLISSFVNGRSLSKTVMTLILPKFEQRYWIVCHSVYLTAFQHLHWKTIQAWINNV